MFLLIRFSEGDAGRGARRREMMSHGDIQRGERNCDQIARSTRGGETRRDRWARSPRGRKTARQKTAGVHMMKTLITWYVLLASLREGEIARCDANARLAN